jgi:hypothetical protein
MGICGHCLQPKPVAANKCPYCHERTGFFMSMAVTAVNKLAQWFAVIFLMIVLYQCVMSPTSGSTPETNTPILATNDLSLQK